MGLLSEFKDFAMRGNVVDMAVGVVIGGAFGKIVTSLVNDIMTPVIGVFTGGTKLNGLGTKLAETTGADGKTVPLNLEWGNFAQTTIDFLIVAACLFAVVKAMNTAKKRFEKQSAAAPPAPPSAEVQLLTEIRDSLRRS